MALNNDRKWGNTLSRMEFFSNKLRLSSKDLQLLSAELRPEFIRILKLSRTTASKWGFSIDGYDLHWTKLASLLREQNMPVDTRLKPVDTGSKPITGDKFTQINQLVTQRISELLLEK